MPCRQIFRMCPSQEKHDVQHYLQLRLHPTPRTPHLSNYVSPLRKPLNLAHLATQITPSISYSLVRRRKAASLPFVLSMPATWYLVSPLPFPWASCMPYASDFCCTRQTRSIRSSSVPHRRQQTATFASLLPFQKLMYYTLRISGRKSLQDGGAHFQRMHRGRWRTSLHALQSGSVCKHLSASSALTTAVAQRLPPKCARMKI